jgi:deazaflavin-dependent oxidoreductase (nitroreductase family)
VVPAPVRARPRQSRGDVVTKRRLTTLLARRVVNPLATLAIRARLLRGWALLETTGRKTGRPRTTPVGNGLLGETFWIVAEHGRKAGYVKNLLANPRVRVFVGGRWRSGTASVLEDDDPRERQKTLPRLNARLVRLMGTDLLTIRIDLDES